MQCEAELPSWARLGAVQVSCEGWKHANDPYILRGSCGLRYDLLKMQEDGKSGWVSTLFFVVFLGFLIFMAISCLQSIVGRLLGPGHNGRTEPNSDGPGYPPPPYPGPGKTVSGRMGFFSGLGLGALAARLFGPSRRQPTFPPQTHYGTMAPYGPYDPRYGTYTSDHFPSSSGTHNSVGFGGTNNR